VGGRLIVTCRTRAERNRPWRSNKILEKLGVTLNRKKPGFVHIAQGFEFLDSRSDVGKAA